MAQLPSFNHSLSNCMAVLLVNKPHPNAWILRNSTTTSVLAESISPPCMPWNSTVYRQFALRWLNDYARLILKPDRNVQPCFIKYIWMYFHISNDSMILFAKQKQTNRYRAQTYGKDGWDELGDWDWHVYTTDTMYKIDN